MGVENHGPAFAAYYGVLQLHAHTLEPIERDFEAQAGFPASWYEVLACLQGAGGEGQRMNELADQLLISRGGATKLIGRMEEAGYVERHTPKSDRRATFAVLTPKGAEAVSKAHPVQLALVEKYFGQFVDDEDRAHLSRISGKVLEGLGVECEWLDELAASTAAGAAADGE